MSNTSFDRVGPIESLETRTMFDATPGPNFAAIMARVQDVAACEIRVSEHYEQCATERSTAQKAAADSMRSGKALLIADRQAIEDNRNDAALLSQAKTKLAADKLQVKADVLAGKTQVRSLKADYRTGHSDLKADSKRNLQLLKRELASSDAHARSAMRKLLKDWETMQIGSDLTSVEMQKLADDLRSAADGATQPSAASVNVLRAHTAVAIADGVLTTEEEDGLLADFQNVFATADISMEKSERILGAASVVLDKINLSNEEVSLIVNDIENVFEAFSGA